MGRGFYYGGNDYVEYTISMGDHYTTYDGTPEEIATLIHYEENGIDIEGKHIGKKELIYDQEEAVNHILEKIADKWHYPAKALVEEMLNADEDYMRSKGIIED